MDSDLYVNERVRVPRGELQLRFSRSGGPGGQNVNKVSSKVTLSWDIAGSPSLDEASRRRLLDRVTGSYLTSQGVISVSSTRERDQVRNRADCERKLVEVLSRALFKPRARKPTRPGRGAIERRLKSKKQRSDLKASRRRDYD